MNKYFINKAICCRYEKEIKEYPYRVSTISDLFILLMGNDYIVSNNKKGWNHKVNENLNYFYEAITASQDNLFEFETDEDALLYFEVMNE